MLLSHSHKFLFVHIQRTGGGTVTKVLEPYAHPPAPGVLNHYLSKAGLVRDPYKLRLPEHATARFARRRLPRAMWDDYFKFAFVRNPWSWIVSLYVRFQTSGPRPHDDLREIERRFGRTKYGGADPPRGGLRGLASRIGYMKTRGAHRHHQAVREFDFPSYVDWEIARDRRHQHRFVCDSRGNLLVDFVGRLEHLDQDLRTVCERVGLPPPADLPRVGARRHADYREYYDRATRDKVARHWARDIELFGYEFG